MILHTIQWILWPLNIVWAQIFDLIKCWMTKFMVHSPPDIDIVLLNFEETFQQHCILGCLLPYLIFLSDSITLAQSHVTPTLNTALPISCVDQYMNYSACFVHEFIPLVLPCWLSAVWRSSVSNYSLCVGSVGPRTVRGPGALAKYKWRLALALWTVLSSASPFAGVSLGLGVFCMLLLGTGWLMKVGFNLVKCCRDQGFGMRIEA